MRNTVSNVKTALIATTLLILSTSFGAASIPQEFGTNPDAGGRIRVQIKPLPEGISRVFLVNAPNGRRQFEMVHIDGSIERLTTEEFAEEIFESQSGKPWQYRILNITSPIGFAWVFVGLMGQVLFTGRLLLQWLVSEKAKRSIVPAGYWWMSLIGASMLLIYFVWRRDIIGVLGLATGWLIYGRNLWLIYHPKNSEL